LKYKKEDNLQRSQTIRFFYVWNYLEWGGAQVYFFGLMKKAAEIGEVSAFLPLGSHKQLLEFLKYLKVPYEFFNGHTDLKPASTVKRKIQRHWNKLYSEYILIKFLRNLNFENSVTHIELAPWQSFLAIRWLCERSQVFITVHNSVLPIPRLRHFLWKIKFGLLSRHKNFHLFTANQDAKQSLKT
jgi:hypothetical protein